MTEQPTGLAASASSRRLVGFILPVLVFTAFAAAPALARFGPEGYILSLLTRAMIFALAAVSLDLILGYGGMVSFGHAAFLGIGAYSVGILASHGATNMVVHLVVTLVACAGFALLIGAVSLRTRGVYFIMITLAFGQMLFFLAVSLAAYGGDDGMTLGSRSLVAEQSLLASPRTFYYFAFACLLATFLVCRAIVASRFGRVLRAAR